MPFKKGSKYGGAKPGAGRPLNVVRKMCQEAIFNDKLIQRLAKVSRGERLQQVVTDEGVEIGVPAAIREQIKAIEVLLDRAYGKAEQSVELHTDDKLSPVRNDVLERIAGSNS